MRLVIRAFLVAILSSLLSASLARADIATTMESELRAAGVPGASVSVATPPPANAAELTAWEENLTLEAPSVLPENLISPDPTSPLPIATVRIGSTARSNLPGLIAPPGGTVPAAEDARLPIWYAEVMAALRRALADGSTLSGVAIHPLSLAKPDMWLTPPSPAYAPPVRHQGTMPAAEVEADIERNLPPAANSADVDVTDVAGERRVRLTLGMPSPQLAIDGAQDAVSYVLRKQIELNASEAGIGGVSVEIMEPLSGTPLFTYAGDATFGQNFHWVSPFVAAWVSRVPSDITNDPVKQTQAQAEQVIDRKLEGVPSP